MMHHLLGLSADVPVTASDSVPVQERTLLAEYFRFFFDFGAVDLHQERDAAA